MKKINLEIGVYIFVCFNGYGDSNFKIKDNGVRW